MSARFVTVLPLILMVLADIAVIVLISSISEWVLKKLFPPKKSLVVWDIYSPEAFLEKWQRARINSQ